MLDRAKKKPLVNVPDDSRFGSWADFSQDLFAKCLNWPDGPIHSAANVKIAAANLVEFVESISYLELTSFEIQDIRAFFRSYDLLLATLEAGPGKPNGFHLSILKPKEKTYEVFAREAKETIRLVQGALEEIETQSLKAQIRHLNGLDSDMKPTDPQVKSNLKLTGELSLRLDNLRQISQGRASSPIPISPPSLRTTGISNPVDPPDLSGGGAKSMDLVS